MNNLEHGEIKDISSMIPTENVKSTSTKFFYYIGNIICLIIVVSFLIFLFLGKEVPGYLIGFIGSIIGYYIARPPYDL